MGEKFEEGGKACCHLDPGFEEVDEGGIEELKFRTAGEDANEEGSLGFVGEKLAGALTDWFHLKYGKGFDAEVGRLPLLLDAVIVAAGEVVCANCGLWLSLVVGAFLNGGGAAEEKKADDIVVPLLLLLGLIILLL